MCRLLSLDQATIMQGNLVCCLFCYVACQEYYFLSFGDVLKICIMKFVLYSIGKQLNLLNCSNWYKTII